MVIGKNLIELDEISSTHEYACKLVEKSKPDEGTVVISNFQKSGRGQRDAVWESETGKNLLVSVILYPFFLMPEQIFLLSQTISLGVINFVKEYLPDEKCFIKWPNDIYFENKKLAGILIQNDLSMEGIDNSVVGIGININQTAFSKGIPNPTSFQLEMNHHFDLIECRNCLFSKLSEAYDLLKSGKFEKIKSQYHQNLYRLGVESDFRLKDGTFFKGTIEGTNEEGKLLISSLSKMLKFDLKEVEFVV